MIFEVTSVHFPHVTWDEYLDLKERGIVGDIDYIIPLSQAKILLRNVTKVYKGTLEQKQKAIQWTREYINSLELAAMVF